MRRTPGALTTPMACSTEEEGGCWRRRWDGQQGQGGCAVWGDG